LATTFLALYRGESANGSKLLALTADPKVVGEFAGRMLAEPEQEVDPIIEELERGRRAALRLVHTEADG
jgi:hypothetical protein